MVSDEDQDDSTRSLIILRLGTKVSHYTIESRIGSGGMGEVYLAHDTELDRQVALKFLSQSMCLDESCRMRFRREAQAAAQLNHPNIVTIYEVAEYDGRPYFAMEHIEGMPLGDLIKSSDLSIENTLDLAIQILEGLSKAHEDGLLSYLSRGSPANLYQREMFKGTREP